MTTYEMTGRPAGAPFSVLTDHVIGDVFEARLDDDTERLLVNSGALRIVETQKKEPARAKASKTKAR